MQPRADLHRFELHSGPLHDLRSLPTSLSILSRRLGNDGGGVAR